MLSKPERQRLAAIEFRLAAEDPRLAAKLQQFDNSQGRSRQPTIRWPLGVVAALFLLTLVCMLSGLVIGAAVVAVGGVGIATWLVWRKASNGDGRSTS